MSALYTAVAGVAGIVLGLVIGSTRPDYPAPIYQVAAGAAVPDGAMVDFGVRAVTNIRAWDDGHGSLVIFDGLTCLWGVKGGSIWNNLLSVGDRVHVRGHLYRDLRDPFESFDCEVVGDKNP